MAQEEPAHEKVAILTVTAEEPVRAAAHRGPEAPTVQAVHQSTGGTSPAEAWPPLHVLWDVVEWLHLLGGPHELQLSPSSTGSPAATQQGQRSQSGELSAPAWASALVSALVAALPLAEPEVSSSDVAVASPAMLAAWREGSPIADTASSRAVVPPLEALLRLPVDLSFSDDECNREARHVKDPEGAAATLASVVTLELVNQLVELPANVAGNWTTLSSEVVARLEEELPKRWRPSSLVPGLGYLGSQHILALRVVHDLAQQAWGAAEWVADGLATLPEAAEGLLPGFELMHVIQAHPEVAVKAEKDEKAQKAHPSEEGFPYVARLQERATEVVLLPDGSLQLPLLTPEPALLDGELPDVNFGFWMAGGPGKVEHLPPQSFFMDYDDADTSITAFGKTYGPQRKPGAPYTMRPFLVVFRRREGAWLTDDFLANFEVRHWDYEFGYVTTERPDAGIALGQPRLLGIGEAGELRYGLNWMQTVGIEVAVPRDGPLLLAGFNGTALASPAPLLRMRSGYDAKSCQWYLAPLPPADHEAPEPAMYNVGFRNSMRMLAAYLQK